MGVTPRNIRPYAVTVYDPEGLIIDRVIAALQGQSKANGGVLLYSHNASAENLAHFMKSKFVLNERDLMVRDIEKTEATILPRNSEVDYYVQYKDLLEDVISPLAFERRRLLNLVPGERYMRRCKPGSMSTLSGARKGEMGFDPKPTGHGYPERSHRRSPRLRRKDTQECQSQKRRGRMLRHSIDSLLYYFREYKGGAIPWEKVRAVAEEHSGYTIRDSDIKDIAPRFSKYGVEALATIQQRKVDDRYQVDRITFVRPSARLGRDVRESLHLDGKDGLSSSDSRYDLEEIPDARAAGGCLHYGQPRHLEPLLRDPACSPPGADYRT